jgi:hypothetical protein
MTMHGQADPDFVLEQGTTLVAWSRMTAAFRTAPEIDLSVGPPGSEP